jgi:hypothetical protein
MPCGDGDLPICAAADGREGMGGEAKNAYNNIHRKYIVTFSCFLVGKSWLGKHENSSIQIHSIGDFWGPLLLLLIAC